MKRGFTLLELLVVVIIIGVLATLGVMQYGTLMERTRGAEAKSVIGSLRSACAAEFMGNGDTAGCGLGDVPGACAGTHYFSYALVKGATNADVTFTATRCTAGGKTPNATTAGTLTLTTNYTAGTDVWGPAGSVYR